MMNIYLGFCSEGRSALIFNKRESLEIVNQSLTPRYVSRFEPLLYVPAFTQKDFRYIVYAGLPTQGTSTEDLGNTTLEYTTPLSTNNNLYTRGKAQHKSPLHLEGLTLNLTMITSH